MRSFKIYVNGGLYRRGLSADMLFIPRPQPVFVRNIYDFEIKEETWFEKIINFFRGEKWSLKH